MRKKIEVGRTIGAAMALSAAVLISNNAHALSELEELMGEPIQALSDNELSELRGGMNIRGIPIDIGIIVRETVDGSLERLSELNIRSVGNDVSANHREWVNRETEYSTDQFISDENTSESIGGAPDLPADAGPDVTTFAAGPDDPSASIQGDGISFQVNDNGSPSAGPAEIGADAAALLASSGLLGATPTTVDQSNSNVSVDRVINLTIPNYSMIDAFAAQARIESKITSVVNSQVLFQLGQQF